jgi:adenine-specific DNA-methyltransferase
MTAVEQPVRSARTNRTGAVEVGEAATDRTFELLAGVPEWWATRASAAGLSGRWLDVEWAIATQMPDDIDVVLAPADLRGLSAYEVGEAYTATLSERERARHGRHYTPESLAAELWAMTKRALGWKRPQALPGLVRDPACGAGALLLPVLRDHLGAAARVDAQVALAGLPNHIAGVDNDEHAVWLGNVLLASQMLPILARTPRARRRPLPALVRLGDGLASSEQRALVTIMNPPYGRVRLSDDERARFSDSLYGHANLYGLFMAAGVDALADQGVMAALVPTSFLAGQYFKNLRAVLVDTAPLREVEFVVNRGGSFDGVLQETCLATFTRARPRRTLVASVNGHVSEVAKVATPRVATPWLLPRRSDDAPVAAAAIAMPLTLSQAGWNVSTGPLVWNRRKEDLRAKPESGALPVLWAADIDGGVVHRDSERDSLRYLVMQGSDERYLVLNEPAVLVQRTTAPEQARRLVSAPLTSETLESWGGRVVVENHVNVLRPTSTLLPPLIDAATLAKLLATETLDRVLRCLSGSVAVSAYELEALPLPSAEVLAAWSKMKAEVFERAVASAYRPVSR